MLNRIWFIELVGKYLAHLHFETLSESWNSCGRGEKEGAEVGQRVGDVGDLEPTTVGALVGRIVVIDTVGTALGVLVVVEVGE